MTVCSSCGNDYKKPIQVMADGATYYFDCFECAIAKLAPICQNCGCKIIGHGIESEKHFFCCSHCARNSEANANAKIPQ
jgi:hypothetical protein